MRKADYSNIKATDLPTVQRLYPPRPATLQKESAMQTLKEKMMRKVREYIEKRCNRKGFIKDSNISKAKARGLKEVKEKIKSKEWVVFTSDKSGKLTADTVPNYTRALKEHTLGDTIIAENKVKTIEKEMNQHLNLIEYSRWEQRGDS